MYTVVTRDLPDIYAHALRSAALRFRNINQIPNIYYLLYTFITSSKNSKSYGDSHIDEKMTSIISTYQSIT